MNQTGKNPKILLPVAAACLLSLVVMIFALLLPQGPQAVEFVPPPFEKTAQQGTPTVPEALGYGQLDAKTFQASLCSRMTVQDGKADVYLTNPKENEVWMKLRVLSDQGKTLGETGLIRPGEYLKSVTFTTPPSEGTSVTLKIMTYEPELYYSTGAVSLGVQVEGG